MNHRVASLMERFALATLVAGIVSGMILGGGVSRTALGVFLIVAGAALGLAALSMVTGGRWRIVRGAGWLLFAGLGAVAVLQMTPGLARWIGDSWTSASGQAISHVAADRSLTMQWLLGLMGGVVIAHVAGTCGRTASRWAVASGTLAISLWCVGLIGFFQTLLGRSQILGLFSPDDPRLTVLLRDVFSVDSAGGFLAYRPWAPGEILRDVAYVPETVQPFYFGGFLDVRHWAACATLIVPLALAACLHGQHFAGVGGLRTHPRSQLALAVWIISLCMAGTAIWMADALVTPVALTAGVLIVLWAAGRDHRRRSIIFSVLYVLVLMATLGAIWLVQGPPDFKTALFAWIQQSQAILQVAWDRPWLGSGLGSMSSVWSGYRPLSVETSAHGSSLLAFFAETGLLGAMVVAFAGVALLARSLRMFNRLDADGRIVLAGSLGGLTAFVIWTLFGPGLDLPVALAIATLLWAFAMRALAGGYREVEEWLVP